MKDLEQTLYYTIIGVLVLVIGIIVFENGRKIDDLTAQFKAMRQDMAEAGYIPTEPKITERK